MCFRWACVTPDGAAAGTLIGHSDIAMYAAKSEGEGQYRFFDHSLSDTIRKRAQLKQGLLEAIEHDQFHLHYQPRVDAVSAELLSMEALLRWRKSARSASSCMSMTSVQATRRCRNCSGCGWTC